ncbi:CPBP family intramembrane metalloprotease [Paracoccus ferrooxidans]|nr:CPBP family intramembrane metalloprotease [Paracoccus ferrooxidans]
MEHGRADEQRECSAPRAGPSVGGNPCLGAGPAVRGGPFSPPRLRRQVPPCGRHGSRQRVLDAGPWSSADQDGGRNAAALEQDSEGLLLGLDGPLDDWRVDFQAGENGCDAGRDGSTGHGRTDRGKDKGLTQAFEIGARSGGLGHLAVALCVVAAWLVLTTSIGLMPRDAPVSLKQVMTTTPAWKNLAALAFLLLAVRLLRGTGLGLRWPDWRTLGRLLWFPLHLAAMAALVGAAGQGMQAAAIHVMVNVIAIGIAEELAFRGVLWGAPRRAMPFWPAFLAVSGVFGIAHMADVAGTGDMQGGIVQSVAAVLSGTGWPWPFASGAGRLSRRWRCIACGTSWSSASTASARRKTRLSRCPFCIDWAFPWASSCRCFSTASGLCAMKRCAPAGAMTRADDPSAGRGADRRAGTTRAGRTRGSRPPCWRKPAPGPTASGAGAATAMGGPPETLIRVPQSVAGPCRAMPWTAPRPRWAIRHCARWGFCARLRRIGTLCPAGNTRQGLQPRDLAADSRATPRHRKRLVSAGQALRRGIRGEVSGCP